MGETALANPGGRWRVPVTAVAVFGLGALVALAVGVVLWLGLGSALESTRSLIQERSNHGTRHPGTSARDPPATG